MFDWQVESRQRLGMVIAATAKVVRKGAVWLVPSQSKDIRYTVCPDPTNPHCTCPDHDATGGKCKHIFAVEYMIRCELNPDGSTTITETRIKRTTYPQAWSAYNAAQTNEKREFQTLLFDLCQLVEEPERENRNGRPRLPLSDAVFATTFKVYSTVSARRFMCDLTDAHRLGLISRVPHFNSVLNYLDNPAMTPVLGNLITTSSLPLRSVETDFAADSTGFTTNRFVPWFDKKYRKWDKREHNWVKAHIMCGVRTNVVTAVEIHERDASDTKQLPSLLATTAEHFRISEVSADKGYSGVNNHNVIVAVGATPFIPFKTNATGQRGGLWEKAFHYYNFNRDDFLAHYHKRSNVESTMMMIKTKFGDYVRSHTETAMANEVLCKVLAHNICCLIQSMYELGVEPKFSTAKAVAVV